LIIASIEIVGDPFPVFYLKNNVKIEEFVALTIESNDARVVISFYLVEVLEFGQQSCETRMKVVWY